MRRELKRSITSLLAAAVLSSGASLIAQAPQGGAGGPGRAGGAGGRGPATPPLIMTSPAWEDGGVIPNKYTQAAEGGAAVSPDYSWKGNAYNGTIKGIAIETGEGEENSDHLVKPEQVMAAAMGRQ